MLRKDQGNLTDNMRRDLSSRASGLCKLGEEYLNLCKVISFEKRRRAKARLAKRAS